jgi:hypothetical protein
MRKELLEMMIKSRKLNRKFEFMRPSGSEYLLVRTIIHYKGHQPGCDQEDIQSISDWIQPCEGGAYSGATVSYSGNDYNAFKTVCQKWYRQHMRGE